MFVIGGERFLPSIWIHFIDSGGQPEFHDLLPLFTLNTSVVVFIFKLSESLHHKHKIEYFDISGPIGDPCELYLTHEEILAHSIKTFHDPSGQSPTILVIGTHKDQPRNRRFKKCLKPISKNVVHFGSEPIALMNCLSKNNQDVIEEIRSNIMEAAESIESKKTPLAWFGLEMALTKVSKPKAGILLINECKKEADKFP